MAQRARKQQPAPTQVRVRVIRSADPRVREAIAARLAALLFGPPKR